MFKKTCFECGSKVDILFEGKCENCFSGTNPPIKEIKPINIKYCNGCKKLNYNNAFYTFKELSSRINNIVKKNVILNEGYVLKELNVRNFKVDNSKLSFEVDVDCELKE